jgi:protoporphyrinogen IX oxidase
LKLSAVLLLILYHFACHKIYREQKRGVYKLSSFKLRLFNELATVFLVAIVFLAVVKSQSGLMWGLVGLVVFAGLLMLFAYLYKRRRNRGTAENPNAEPKLPGSA